MTNRFILLLTLFMTIALWNGLHAQVQTDKSLLLKMAGEFKAKEELDLQRALAMAKQKGWFLQRHTPNGGLIKLIGVDDLGNPKYVSTFDNIIAAATTKANQLWPGGSSGLNLSGSSAAVKGKLAIWDGGHALTTHVELVGRITLGDVADVEGHLALNSSWPMISAMMKQRWLRHHPTSYCQTIPTVICLAQAGPLMARTGIGTAILPSVRRWLTDLATIVSMHRSMIPLLTMLPNT
jgi:hypothetical protein